MIIVVLFILIIGAGTLGLLAILIGLASVGPVSLFRGVFEGDRATQAVQPPPTPEQIKAMQPSAYTPAEFEQYHKYERWIQLHEAAKLTREEGQDRETQKWIATIRKEFPNGAPPFPEAYFRLKDK